MASYSVQTESFPCDDLDWFLAAPHDTENSEEASLGTVFSGTYGNWLKQVQKTMRIRQDALKDQTYLHSDDESGIYGETRSSQLGKNKLTTLPSGSKYKRPTDNPNSCPLFIVVFVGGINGGIEGPSGLYSYLAQLITKAEKQNKLSGEGILKEKFQGNFGVLRIDTKHSLKEAIPALRQGLRWIFHKYPQLDMRYSCSDNIFYKSVLKQPRIFLVGCSMGTATISTVGSESEFLPSIRGLISLCGQSCIRKFPGIPILIIHGGSDLCVGVEAAARLTVKAFHGKSNVETWILDQSDFPINENETFGSTRDITEERKKCLKNENSTKIQRFMIEKHHMWFERHGVSRVVCSWLAKMSRKYIKLNYSQNNGDAFLIAQKFGCGISAKSNRFRYFSASRRIQSKSSSRIQSKSSSRIQSKSSSRKKASKRYPKSTRQKMIIWNRKFWASLVPPGVNQLCKSLTSRKDAREADES